VSITKARMPMEHTIMTPNGAAIQDFVDIGNEDAT